MTTAARHCHCNQPNFTIFSVIATLCRLRCSISTTLSVVHKRSDVAKIILTRASSPSYSRIEGTQHAVYGLACNSLAVRLQSACNPSATRLQPTSRQLSARKVTIEASVPFVEGGDFLIASRHGEVATSAAHQFEAWSGLPRLEGLRDMESCLREDSSSTAS